MSDDAKPLRCPFCGGKPYVGKGQRHKTDGYYPWQPRAGEWRWKPSIKCARCKIVREFESVEEAIAWWNKRA